MSEAKFTRDEFAAMLNGREYRAEMSTADERKAHSSRLLVVFGSSDDLTEFHGIIHDEVGAYGSADHFIKFGKTGVYLVPTLDDNGNDIEPDRKGALIERKLPGCGFVIDRGSNQGSRACRASIEPSEELWTYHGWPTIKAATPAIALCLAFCRAKAALAEDAGHE